MIFGQRAAASQAAITKEDTKQNNKALQLLQRGSHLVDETTQELQVARGGVFQCEKARWLL
jgi:hypothetical protein